MASNTDLGPLSKNLSLADTIGMKNLSLFIIALTLNIPAFASNPDRDADQLAQGEVRKLAMEAIKTEARDLIEIVPSDMNFYCRNYNALNDDQRLYVWSEILTRLAWGESKFQANLKGDVDPDGKTTLKGEDKFTHGLTQLTTSLARQTGCRNPSIRGLRDPSNNLRCAARRLHLNVKADGKISVLPKRRARPGDIWTTLTSRPKRRRVLVHMVNMCDEFELPGPNGDGILVESGAIQGG